jgi:hypothetical protein
MEAEVINCRIIERSGSGIELYGFHHPLQCLIMAASRQSGMRHETRSGCEAKDIAKLVTARSF